MKPTYISTSSDLYVNSKCFLVQSDAFWIHKLAKRFMNPPMFLQTCSGTKTGTLTTTAHFHILIGVAMKTALLD